MSEKEIINMLALLYGIKPERTERYIGYCYGKDSAINGVSRSWFANLDRKEWKENFSVNGDMSDIFYIGNWQHSIMHYSNPAIDYGLYMTVQNITEFDLQSGFWDFEQEFIFRYDSDQVLASSVGAIWPSVKKNEVWTFTKEKEMMFSITAKPSLVLETDGPGSALFIQINSFFNGYRFFLR